MKRFLCLGAVLCLLLGWVGCGQVFRPIIIPNPPQFPNPAAAHTVVTLNDNGTFNDGSAMVIDVSGDSVVSIKSVGLNPVHAVMQSATQALVVNQSNASLPQDSVTKLFFSGTTIGGTTTITLPPSYDASGNLTTGAPNFVATTEANQAYVLMPQYQPPNQNNVGGTIVPSFAVINTTLGSTVTTIPVGNSPVAMVETPDGAKLYVANQGDGTLNAFNTRPSILTRTINGSPTAPPIWLSARTDSQQVKIDLVNGFADAALADDDDFCAHDLGHLGIGEIENRPDPGVAGTFAQNKILFPRDAVKGLDDFFDQRLVIGRLQIFAREIRLHRDRTHVQQRTIELVHLVHQHGVLVNLLLLDFDKALADRLDVADARIKLLQRGEQPERGGRLALVLPGGGDENARRGGVQGRRRSGMLGVCHCNGRGTCALSGG